MVARITRLLIVVQCLIGIALFFLCLKVLHLHSVWMALAISVLFVAVARLSITANSFLLAWIYRSETPSEFRITWQQATRLFRSEFNASMISSSWSMAFRTFDKRPAAHPVGLPVLLIHGYGCNSGYWNGMSKQLSDANITHHAVNLEPVLADIDSYVPAIHQAIRTLLTDSGSAQVILVAHSMGGLACRAYLRDHGSARIAKVITLGTPHRGTGLANFGVGENSKQMRWNGDVAGGGASDWLRRLEAAESPATYALFVSIYSHHDNIVSPQLSSHLEGATNMAFHGIGHVALGMDTSIQACVIAQVLAISTTR